MGKPAKSKPSPKPSSRARAAAPLRSKKPTARAAGPAQISAINPMGTDGFEFVEYTAPDTEALGKLFESLGFVAVAKHRSKNVTLYRQGEINFIVNAEPDSFAQAFARVHGPRPAPWRSVWPMRRRRSSARSLSAPSRSRARSGRWSSTSRRSRGSAAA